VQFTGYWVSGFENNVTVIRDTFDETDLTEVSNWTRAMQNEDPNLAHGFINPIEMLADVCRRIGASDGESLLDPADQPIEVTTLANLSALVTRVLQTARPQDFEKRP
jgi:hypothetical protein